MKGDRVKISDLAKHKASDAQWDILDIAIKTFVREHPVLWLNFQKSLEVERNAMNPYKQANTKEKELRKSGWRHTCSFPNAELLTVIEKIIPGLTHNDSINYAKFLKKYPQFIAGEKF